ncbi:hypothetical protein L208DRAFT_1400799 [Tricholoma matsutake]|nr:hypothetical protein L208DRAFT_1400799 [Tricholoma matsutake 945]
MLTESGKLILLTFFACAPAASTAFSAFPVSSEGDISPSDCATGFRPGCQRKVRPAPVEIPRSRCSLRMALSCCASSFCFVVSDLDELPSTGSKLREFVVCFRTPVFA